ILVPINTSSDTASAWSDSSSAVLRTSGSPCSRRRLVFLRKGLVVAAKRQRRYGSYLGEISPAPSNLINRDFQAAAPNEKWFTDITQDTVGEFQKALRTTKESQILVKF
ncbi:MAG: Integrase, catalytic region, partial [Polaromonas sp.]|nr:Integrase, catalytic region [Polaromonas sp.]